MNIRIKYCSSRTRSVSAGDSASDQRLDATGGAVLLLGPFTAEDVLRIHSVLAMHVRKHFGLT